MAASAGGMNYAAVAAVACSDEEAIGAEAGIDACDRDVFNRPARSTGCADICILIRACLLRRITCGACIAGSNRNTAADLRNSQSGHCSAITYAVRTRGISAIAC